MDNPGLCASLGSDFRIAGVSAPLTSAILALMENAAPPTVEVNFTLGIGPGRLDASAVVPAGETNLTQLLPVLQDLSSSIIDGAVQIAESEGFKISCRAGCGALAVARLIPLSIFEAELLWPVGSALSRRSARSNSPEARFDAAPDSPTP